MYKVLIDKKQLNLLKSTTFNDLKLKERFDLQEWIRANPEVLGEPLLIIQKEFDGFKETRERLDLLAIDKKGNLVIIENKTDESGKDTVWQSLKYAAYCYSLQRDDIVKIYGDYLSKHGLIDRIDSVNSLLNFLDVKDLSEIEINKENSQRIILVSREFSHEVKATAFWLLNYSIDIKCIKVNLYQDSGSIFVDFEQFLPPRETEAIITQLRNKSIIDKISNENESNKYKLNFWSELLVSINNTELNIFRTISPLKENWLYKSTSINGVGYVFKITQTTATVRIDISGSGSSKEWCNLTFNEFLGHKNAIEEKFGEELIWNNPIDTKGATISSKEFAFDLKNRDEWQSAIDYLTDKMIKLYYAVNDLIPSIKENIKI